MNYKGALSLRKILVVLQFTISIILIIGALVIGKQVHFMQSAALGLNKDQVIIVKNEGTLPDADKDAFRNTALEINGVKKVAASDGVLGGQTWTINLHVQGSKNAQLIDFLSISDDYIGALGIQLKEGRSFSEKFPTDIRIDLPDDRSNKLMGSVILNETAVKELGIREPAVGKYVFWGENYLRVIGVVKDFHFTSFHNKIKPFAFINDPERMGNFTIKLSTNNIKVTLGQLQDAWHKFSPERPFEYFFLDETYGKLYQSEIHFEQLFTSLVILGILIACLGLFGLSTFVSQQRVKEIGIRKVLGASVFTITKLLSVDFIKLVCIAIIIASPIAWYVMHKWLQGYAYRININWFTFFIAGLLAVAIAFVTISFQSIKAAVANPVKSLRTE
jgi:putative ABC transport system permease protein